MENISPVSAYNKIQNQTTADINSLIADMESQQAAYHNLIQTTRSNITNTDFVNRAIEGHRESIRFHQRMIEQFQNSVQNGPDIIADAQKNLKQLKLKIALCKNKREIDKMMEMQKELNGNERIGVDPPAMP